MGGAPKRRVSEPPPLTRDFRGKRDPNAKAKLQGALTPTQRLLEDKTEEERNRIRAALRHH